MPFQKLNSFSISAAVALLIALVPKSALAVDADILRELSKGIGDEMTNFQEEYRNLMEKARAAERIAILKKQFDANSIMRGMNIDNENNGFANWIIRIGNQQEGIHDSELAASEQPAYDACANVTVSDNLKDGLVAASAFRKEIAGQADRGSHRKLPTGASSATAVTQEFTAKLNTALQSAGVLPTQGEKSSKPANPLDVLDSSVLLSSSPESKSLSGAAVENAKSMIFVLAPPSNVVLDSNMSDAMKADKLATKLKQNIPNKVFSAILSKRIAATGGSSILEARQAQADFKWAANPSGEGGMLQMITTSPALHPDNINRSRAVMRAFQVYNAVEAYEDSLTRELMLANILASRVNPK